MAGVINGCINCLRKARPIFKQHILALYPTPAEARSISEQYPQLTNPQQPDYSLFHDPLAQPRNLSDLTYYAQLNPNKLTRIGRYMLKKLRQFVDSRDLRFTHLTVLAFIGLVDACHSDDLLILYDESVCDAIQLLLTHPLPDHRILASQALCKLINYIDEAADYRKYELFFQPLVDMAVNQPLGNTARRQVDMDNRVRLAGLQGLNAMVIHFYSARLVDHYSEVVPALLANIHDVHVDRTNDPETITIATLSSHAYDTLALIAVKVSVPELEAVLAPVLTGLDAGGWQPVPRCASVMIVLTNGMQVEGDLVLFDLLKHALTVDRRFGATDTALIKARILTVASSLIANMRINVLHWEGISDLLIQNMLASLSSSPLQLVSSPTSPYIQSAVICFSSYAQKLPTPQDLISLLFYVSQFSYTSAPPYARHTFLRTLNLILQSPTNLSAASTSTATDTAVFTSSASVETLLRSLLTCAVVSPDVRVREEVYDVLLQLLVPQGDEDEENNSEEQRGRKVERFMSVVGDGKRGLERQKCIRLTEREQRWILTILYYELSESIISITSTVSSITVTSAPSASSLSNGEPVISASSQPLSTDQIVITVEDEKSITSSIKAPGRGSTSARCFQLAYRLLLALLYQSPAQSLAFQWPLLVSLQQLASSAHIMSLANCQRCHLLTLAYIAGVSRVFQLDNARETRQPTTDLLEYAKQVQADRLEAGETASDETFEAESMTVSAVRNGTATSEAVPFANPVDTDRATQLLIRLLDAAATASTSPADVDDADTSTDVAASSSAAPSLAKELAQPFESFNVKYLPPSRLVHEERETSWAPSHRPEKERRYSFDTRESLTRIDSPFHSPRTDKSMLGTGGIGAVTEVEEAKAVDEQSYAAVAMALNVQTTRSDAVFRQSMRVLVDQMMNEEREDREQLSQSRPLTPHSTTSSASHHRQLSSRRRSLSGRRGSGGLLSSTLSSTHSDKEKHTAAATADKFFAAPAIAAPPTLNVNAAIRQQIESSYALSPSHAVSGSVNVNGLTLDEEGAATPVKHNMRRSSVSTGSTAGGSSKGAGEAEWTKESWSLAEQRIDVGAVTEDDEDDPDVTDDIVYGLAEDMRMDGGGVVAGHVVGTADNILKFQFPSLNTFDSYLSAELE